MYRMHINKLLTIENYTFIIRFELFWARVTNFTIKFGFIISVLTALISCGGGSGGSSEPTIIKSTDINLKNYDDPVVQQIYKGEKKLTAIKILVDRHNYGGNVIDALNLQSVDICSSSACYRKDISTAGTRSNITLKAGNVVICHIPPGNPSAARTITVGESAVSAHLGHGDTLGPCGSDTTGIGAYNGPGFNIADILLLDFDGILQSIKLNTPNSSILMNIPGGLSVGDVSTRFVVLMDLLNQGGQDIASFVTSSISSGLDEQAQSYVYRVDEGLKVSGTNGFNIDIPPGATSENAMLTISNGNNPGTASSSYHVNFHTDGNEILTLSKEVTVTVPLSLSSLPSGVNANNYYLFYNGGRDDAVITTEGDKAVFTLKTKYMPGSRVTLGERFDFIPGLLPAPLPEIVEPPYSQEVKAPTSSASNATTMSILVGNRYRDLTKCINSLKDFKSWYDTGANVIGIVRIENLACLHQPPFTEMVLMNTGKPPIPLYPYSNTKMSFAYDKISSDPDNYKLKTISEHANSKQALVAINGFAWVGNKGFRVLSDVGLEPKGTTYFDGVQAGESQTGKNEVSIGFTKETNGQTLAKFFNVKGGDILHNPYKYNLFSSTTSILKNGVCSATSGDPEDVIDLWSAVGIENNKVLFLSSASGSTTNTYEMCQVFKALGFNNALRSDGGASASIFYNGEHLNTITDVVRKIAFGPARKLMYVIVGKH